DVVVDDLDEATAQRTQRVAFGLLNLPVPARVRVRRMQLPPDAADRCALQLTLRAPAPALDQGDQFVLGESPVAAGCAEDMDLPGIGPASDGRLVHSQYFARTGEADPASRGARPAAFFVSHPWLQMFLARPESG